MSLSKFKTTAIRCSTLYDFDERELEPAPYVNGVAARIADRIICILDARRDYRGSAVMHGSFTKGTNLREPGLSDIDILCYINEDYHENQFDYLSEYEEVREEASQSVVRHLLNNLPHSLFYDVELVENWKGLCAKFRLKNSDRARYWWYIDIIFAYEAKDKYTTIRELDDMSFSDAIVNKNALSEWRNDFIREKLDANADLKILVRLLKYFNKKVVDHSGKKINSFVFEALVAILYGNTIPHCFDINRALCTCFHFIGCGGDIWCNGAPTDGELARMRRNSGDGGLIIVDPLATFNNIAARTRKTQDAWRQLKQSALDIVQFLKSNGVASYVRS